MTTMKAAIIKGERDLSVGQIDFDPTPSRNEVTISVQIAAICGTDIHLFTGARKPARVPLVLGHECAGVVARVGSEVSRFQVGDRVVLQPNYACDSCQPCLTGRYNICQQRPIPGVNIDGCFAQYIKAPERFVWKLPDELSFSEGALVEPASVALHAVKRGRAGVGETAVVVGIGSIGVLVMQILKLAGLRAIGVDLLDDRGRRFLQLGGDHYINAGQGDVAEKIKELTNGQGADLVFEAAGVSATAELALQLPKEGGRVVLIGLSNQPASFIPLQIARREIEVIGSIIYVQEFKQVIELIQRKALKLEPMMGPVFELDDALAALTYASKRTDYKVLIKCN